MQFSFGLESSLLLVFFVHILVYACMLWIRGIKQESLPDKLLGSFLLVSALFIIPWMTGFAGWYAPNTIYREILFYTPFVHGLLIGPLLYLYLKSLTNFEFRFQPTDWLHFLPGALYILWCVVVVVVDKVIVGRYFLMNGENDPDFALWYQILQKVSIAMYLVVTLRYYKKYKQYVRYEMSFYEAVQLKWLQHFIIAFTIISFLPLFQDLLELTGFYEGIGGYVRSWFYFMAYAIVVYYMAIQGFNAINLPLRKLLFKPNVLLNYSAPAQIAFPVENKNIEDASFELLEKDYREETAIEEWKNNIREAMETQKLFEDAELTLTQLSKKVGSNPSVISKVINQGFGQNFNDFVNTYRIEAFTNQLKKGEHKHKTLLSIAFDCGFNSKATFNRAFKKKTGFNPKDWIMQQDVNPGNV